MSLERSQKLAALNFSSATKADVSNGVNRFGTPFPNTGKLFTDLEVTGAPFTQLVKGQHRTFMPVQCKCGTTGKVSPRDLTTGRSKRCNACRLLMTPALMLKNRVRNNLK
jgi:hypothetical protein